jgi:hypothetical protein
MGISVFYSDFGKLKHPPIKVIYISSAAISLGHLESEVTEVSNYHHSINLGSTSIQHVEGCSICTIILYQCMQPLELHIRHPEDICLHIGLTSEGFISKMSPQTAQSEKPSYSYIL